MSAVHCCDIRRRCSSWWISSSLAAASTACETDCTLRCLQPIRVRFRGVVLKKKWGDAWNQCRINANRGPVAIICPTPLTYARLRPITASQSSRCDMLAIFYIPLSIRPIFIFLLQKLCHITWLLSGWKFFLYFRRPPWGLRPVAFATSATWLIRHYLKQDLDKDFLNNLGLHTRTLIHVRKIATADLWSCPAIQLLVFECL